MPYGDNSEPVSPVGGIFQNTRRTSIAKHSPAARLRSGADRRYCWRGGRLAQLVERHVYTVDVGGSSPSPPTTSLPGMISTRPRWSRLCALLEAAPMRLGGQCPWVLGAGGLRGVMTMDTGRMEAFSDGVLAII